MGRSKPGQIVLIVLGVVFVPVSLTAFGVVMWRSSRPSPPSVPTAATTEHEGGTRMHDRVDNGPGPSQFAPPNDRRIGLDQNNGCGIFEGGKVRCWGYNEFGNLGVPRAQDGPPATINPTVVNGI